MTSDLPAAMTAIAISAPGGPDVLRPVEAPVPAPGPGELLIRVHAAGVNGPDLAQRRGHYDPPPGASPLPGLEVAGTVVALGPEASGFAVGDRVVALTNGGGYAEYAAVPHGQVLPLPDGWTMAQGAALPETFFTVMQTLVMRAGLAPGMTVLVHGAAGGIGGAAIQIAKALGARAIGVVSSPEKADYARALGAVATIDHRSEDIAARVAELTEGRGADRILDIVGGPMLATSIAAAAIGGHIVQVSTLGGGDSQMPLRTLMMKQLTLSGSTLRPQSARFKAEIAGRLRADIWPAIAAGTIVPPAIRTFPLADAAGAHRAMEDRANLGKIVLLTPAETVPA